MGDDGNGHAIKIPSMIISKLDGDKIKETLKDGKAVFIKASLDIYNPDNRVEYELWMSSFLDVEKWNVKDIYVY